MRALVVGADGFAGRWLVRHLHASGDEVTGLVGSRYRAPLDGASHVASVDVREYDPLAAAIALARPDALYFLAAVSQAGGRERVADATRIGLVGAIHALTACAELGQPVRFLQVSSSHVYGADGAGLLNEDSPIRPASVYGATKAASEQALISIGPAVGVEVVVARAFNHIGPGQASTFLVPSLAEQVRAIPRGKHGTILVGIPEMVRDFTDVRDVVRAYRLLVNAGKPGGAYNVASGIGRSVRDLVLILADVFRVTVEVAVDPSLAQSGEPMTLIGDNTLLTQLGWEPEWDLRTTLGDVLDAESN